MLARFKKATVIFNIWDEKIFYTSRLRIVT
jgi:hypothetical protein